jgi:serine protease Do
MNTPAGWYPQPDGQQRYWDGEQWTEHFAPGALPAVERIPATGALGGANVSDGLSDDGFGATFAATIPVGAHAFAAHCTKCGGRFPARAGFCGSCGIAQPAAPWAAESPPTRPLPSVAPTMSGPAVTVAAYDMPVLAAPIGAPLGTRPADRARAGRKGGVAIASVVALALAGGAAGGFLMTRQQATVSPTPATRPPAAAQAKPVAATPSTSPSPTSTVQSFADLYRNVNSGVVRIQATTCDGGGVGTGFLIAPNLVATVAHVVNESAALNLTFGEKGAGGTTSGTVVGIDPQADVALVRLDRSIRGHVFTMTTSAPPVGQEVAAIGFPVGDPMTFTRGMVSGLDRIISIENITRSGLIETDAAINPGNSGGPLLSLDGQVVGLVDAKHREAEGIGYAVAPTTAHPLLKSWVDNITSAVSTPCAYPAGPPQGWDLAPTLPASPDPTTQGVGQVLKRYFDGINSADYAGAWSTLSPKLQGPSWSSFAKGTATSYDTQVALLSVTPGAGRSVTAHVTFTSVQASNKGPDGDTCDNWDLDYTLVPSGSSWLIDRVLAHNGGRTHTTC